jgi:hypothetical protein
MHTASVLVEAIANLFQTQFRKLIYLLLVGSWGDRKRWIQCGSRAVLLFEAWAFSNRLLSVWRLSLTELKSGIDSQGRNFEFPIFTFTYHLHEIIVNYYMNHLFLLNFNRLNPINYYIFLHPYFIHLRNETFIQNHLLKDDKKWLVQIFRDQTWIWS